MNVLARHARQIGLDHVGVALVLNVHAERFVLRVPKERTEEIVGKGVIRTRAHSGAIRNHGHHNNASLKVGCYLITQFVPQAPDVLFEPFPLGTSLV